MDQERVLTTALMRRMPDTYVPFYEERGITISAERAQEQYESYAEALRSAGLEVRFMDGDDSFPDCVFLEDPAVVWAPRALMGRLAPHREGEQVPVEQVLRTWHEVVRVPPGALLEGGDVLHVGDTTYVGLTQRTNQAGAEALRAFLSPVGRRVVGITVKNYLHLKTAMTYLGDGMVVAVPDFDMRHFDIGNAIFTDPSELGAANCLRINDTLLIPSGYPRAGEKLRGFAEKLGLGVIELDISEFEKADGSLTCLCITW